MKIWDLDRFTPVHSVVGLLLKTLFRHRTSDQRGAKIDPRQSQQAALRLEAPTQSRRRDPPADVPWESGHGKTESHASWQKRLRC